MPRSFGAGPSSGCRSGTSRVRSRASALSSPKGGSNGLPAPRTEHTLHAMEAIRALGVSRGIDTFHRVALFERRGQGSYLASSLGFYPTAPSPVSLADNLGELEGFRQQVYRNLREGPGIADRLRVPGRGCTRLSQTCSEETRRASGRFPRGWSKSSAAWRPSSVKSSF